jgi:hypothetical protein
MHRFDWQIPTLVEIKNFCKPDGGEFVAFWQTDGEKLPLGLPKW